MKRRLLKEAQRRTLGEARRMGQRRARRHHPRRHPRQETQHPLDDARLPEGIRNLTKLALAVPRTPPRNKAQRRPSSNGSAALWRCRLPTFSILSANFALSAGRLFQGRSSCTSGNVWLAGKAAWTPAHRLFDQPARGLILAFVGMIQLKMFGASTFPASWP
ncbi:MAG: hypothetical protein ACLR0N_01395 [Bilophila wadsworthia]